MCVCITYNTRPLLLWDHIKSILKYEILKYLYRLLPRMLSSLVSMLSPISSVAIAERQRERERERSLIFDLQIKTLKSWKVPDTELFHWIDQSTNKQQESIPKPQQNQNTTAATVRREDWILKVVNHRITASLSLEKTSKLRVQRFAAVPAMERPQGCSQQVAAAGRSIAAPCTAAPSLAAAASTALGTQNTLWKEQTIQQREGKIVRQEKDASLDKFLKAEPKWDG